MARMNWNRVRSEASMTHYGWHRAEETYQTKKKKKKRKRKKPTTQSALVKALESGSASKRETKQLARLRLAGRLTFPTATRERSFPWLSRKRLNWRSNALADLTVGLMLTSQMTANQ
jgi:hypothetical protein